MENTSSSIQLPRFLVAKKLFKMLQASLAIEPVLVNLIAIALGMGLLFLLHHPALFPKLGKYHQYLINLTYGLILLQTIKSSTRSLFIPIIALSIAGLSLGLFSLMPEWQLMSFDLIKKLMLLGAIGVATSIFVMK